MDFRNNRPTVQPASPAPENLGDTRPPAPKGPKRRRDGTKFVKAFYISFLIAIAILLLAMVLSIAFAKNNDYQEKKYVNNDQLQAVFLNGGQVYFGHISDLNSKYLTLNNIYYLRVNQQVQPEQQNAEAGANDISLVKLGCELHGPEDIMVVNREQVIFWENLKTDGQVTKAVEAYVKANPDGQKCQDNSQQGGNNNSSSSNGQTNNQSGTNGQENNNSSGSNNGNEASISTP
jgi:hypothetical protein